MTIKTGSYDKIIYDCENFPPGLPQGSYNVAFPLVVMGISIALQPSPCLLLSVFCILDIINAVTPKSDFKFNFVIFTREDPLKTDSNRRNILGRLFFISAASWAWHEYWKQIRQCLVHCWDINYVRALLRWHDDHTILCMSRGTCGECWTAAWDS